MDAAPAPGSLQPALARALGDPELRIAYPISNQQRYVDASGSRVDEPVARSGRGTTRLVRNDRTVAVIAHAADAALEHEIGPAVRLALENERLQAELLFELDQLRDSRARIVEAADEERRRLERDLHDGAQQQLLALSYDVRLACANAENSSEAGRLLTRAVDQTQRALADLRDLAHGVYPAVLAEAGLAAALATFADTAMVPIEIRMIDRRFPARIETSVYFAVAEAVDDASQRGAEHVSITTTDADDGLVVIIEDDGADRTAPMVAVADRVGALGGNLALGATTCSMEIPCA